MLRGRSGLLAALVLGATWIGLIPGARAAEAVDPCSRPAPGSALPEPRDLRSEHGVLKLDLQIHNHREPDGSVRYCYRLAGGTESPPLRPHPRDWVVLRAEERGGG